MLVTQANKILLFIALLCCTPALTAQQASNDSIIAALPPVAANTAKDTAAVTYVNRKFQKNFRDKYSGDDDYNYVQEPPTDTLLDKFFRFINRILDFLFGGNGKKTSILWPIIAFAVVGLVIYFIIRAIINKDSLWIFGRSDRGIDAPGDEAVNIHEMDFAKLIEQTRRDADYRQAIRYYYLWVLKRLSARQLIDWHWDKTNSDYLYEIKDSALRTDFEYLSYVYDHSWYGDFSVDEKAFAKAERAFKKTLNTI